MGILSMTAFEGDRVRIRHHGEDIWVHFIRKGRDFQQGSVHMCFSGPIDFEIARESVVVRDSNLDTLVRAGRMLQGPEGAAV